jgi:hypothetical protein
MVVKFAEQFVMVLDALRASGLYDESDGFFYDRLVDPNGNIVPIKVQTLVGLIPAMPAVSLSSSGTIVVDRVRERLQRRAEQHGWAMQSWRTRESEGERRVLVSVVSPDQLRRLLATMLDEDAFLSPHGLRSISARHRTPYTVPGLPDAVIDYQPAESRTAMYGGNSNWRGPVWFPTNYLAIRALLQYDQFFGDALTVEYPTGSGRQSDLRAVADDLANRLVGIWLPDENGRRPVYGGLEVFQSDPAWKDNLLFHEYFHGDIGAGLGAAHQTGWTALVADLILDPPRNATRLIGHLRDQGVEPEDVDLVTAG